MLWVCLISLLVNILFFLPKIDQVPFNLDELAWINDGRFYTFLMRGQIEKFDFQASDNNGSGWGKLGYRSQDQPALGKLLYGFWTTQYFNPHFYEKEYAYENALFVKQQLNGADVSTLNQYFSPQTLGAIHHGRVLAFMIDSALLMVFSLVALKLFRSLFIWGILLIGVVTHPQLQNTFLVATTDGLVALMILVLLYFLLLYHQKILEGKFFISAAFLVAVTTAIKLNGIFFLLPFWIGIGERLHVESPDFKKITAKILLFTALFGVFFIILNPSLWLHPITYFSQIFLHRISFIIRFRGGATPSLFFLSDIFQSVLNDLQDWASLGWLLLAVSGIYCALEHFHSNKENRIFLFFLIVSFFSTWLYYIPSWSRYLAPFTVFYFLLCGYSLHKLLKTTLSRLRLLRPSLYLLFSRRM